MFEKVSVMEKVYALEGIITVLLRKFFVSECRKVSWGNLCLVTIFENRKKLFFRGL